MGLITCRMGHAGLQIMILNLYYQYPDKIMMPTTDKQVPVTVERSLDQAEDSKRETTPLRSPRTNRIFKDQSTARNQISSPPQKMQASETTQYNSSRLRSPVQQAQPIQQPCTVYYRQGYGLSRPSIASFSNALSPQKLSLVKSTSILEYENSLLRKQLQQRDDVILMFKNGWSPTSTPLNDGIIKNLNLKLAQKNVVIEQVHRNLLQFQQIVTKQKIEISPICKERFKILLDLVLQHEHYPIIVRERVIETSRNAEKIFIREDGYGQEWQIKMERSYQELVTIKQRLEWFQRQNWILESTIAGLRAGNGREDSKVEMQKLVNQVIMLQQEASNYQYQINSLKSTLGQMSKNPPVQPKQPDADTSKFKEEIARLQGTIGQKDGEIGSMRDLIARLKDEITGLTNKEARTAGENAQLKATVGELRARLNSWDKDKDASIKVEEQNRTYQLRLAQLDKELLISMGRISQLQKTNKILSEQASKWKKHLEQAQSYIEQLLKQFIDLQDQLTKPHPNTQKLALENEQLQTQITKLLTSIDKLRAESESLRQEQNRLNQNVEQYKVQIREYSGRIQVLIKERDAEAGKWRAILEKKEGEFVGALRDAEGRVRKDTEGVIADLRKQIDTLRLEISTLNSGRNTELTKIKSQYQQTIARLQKQTQSYILQIRTLKQSESPKDWQLELSQQRQDYQKKLKQVWDKLNAAQQFIFNTQESTKSEITSLKSSLSQLEFENEKLKKNQNKDQYLYKLDSRYAEIQKKLLVLSSKSTQSISTESQFWEQYRNQRKKDLQEIQGLINESLSLIGNVEQAIVVKREELYRLDFAKLEDLLREIGKIRDSKGQAASGVRESIESKFYGILKTVSTPIPQ